MCCSAAIGGTRVERSAGTSEASRVTTTPTSSETTTVRDVDHQRRWSAGRSRTRRRAASSPSRSEGRRAIPSDRAEQRRSASASTITEVRICLARRRACAASRTRVIRWATVIEKVLKITKAPTISAREAKTSRKICRKLRLSRISFGAAVGVLLARSRPGPRAASPARSALQLVGDDAGVGGDRDLVEAADIVGDPLRLGQGELGDAGAAEGGCRRAR